MNMKSITDTIKEATDIKESRQVRFSVAFNDFCDAEHLPYGVDILVDAEIAKEFDKFLADQEGNIFAHACGDMDTCY